MIIFYAFLRRRKKIVASPCTTPVHDLAISAALLSLLPYPLAILRLIDTADLFLRKHRSLLQLLVDKEYVVELLRFPLIVRVCTDLFVYEQSSTIMLVLFFMTFVSSLSIFHRSASNGSVR